ncbi:MAG TPA: Ig-like domain-containing protein [Steroidobacteraceae bacterium]|nr:Ig-like domain-containing protein [Steroidobacteraceae bacterium]
MLTSIRITKIGLLFCLAAVWSNAQAASTLWFTTSSPVNYGSDAPRAGTIASLSFSATLNPATVSTNHVTLRRRGSTTAEPIAISTSGNAFFVMPNRELLPATTYTISVEDLQGSKGELLSNPFSITFRTRDAQWQSAQQLQNGIGIITASHLAMNKDGSAMAIWSQQTNSSKTSLWASRYNGQQWEAAQPVSNNPDGEVLYSAIAVGPNGTAAAVWQEHYESGYNNDSNILFRIWASVFSPASGWTIPHMVDSGNSQHTWSSPQVAITADGKVTVVWSQDTGTSPRTSPNQYIGRIFATQYIQDSGWTMPTILDAYSKYGSIDPSIAFDGNNYGYALWEQYWHDAVLVWGSRYTPDHGWAAPQIIQTDRTRSSSNVQIAFDGQGNAIAVWIQIRDIVTARYKRDQGWNAAVAVKSESYSSGNTSQIAAPGIAMNKNGDAFVVWTELVPTSSTGTVTRLRSIPWSMRYTVKGGWESPVLLESPDAYISTTTNGVSIVIDEAGNALAAWSGNNGAVASIYTNRYQVGKGWIGGQMIDTSNPSGAFNPGLGIDVDGNGLALWEQFDGSGFPSSIWTSHFK